MSGLEMTTDPDGAYSVQARMNEMLIASGPDRQEEGTAVLEKVIEMDPDADYLTRRVTERAVAFIEIPRPAMMLVASPVSDALAMVLTGLNSVPV